jgi:hypothetical protein
MIMSKETLGPPFLEKDGWERFTSDPPPPEFWSAVRLDLQTGEIVLQLGVKPHPRTDQRFGAFMVAGFRKWWKVPADGTYAFTGHFEPHRITVRNHGAGVATQAILTGTHNFDQRDIVSFTPVDLTFQIIEKKDMRILIAYAAIIQMTFTADQTATAEILARAGTLVRESRAGAAVAAGAGGAQLQMRPRSSSGPLDHVDVADLLIKSASTTGKNAVRVGSELRQDL